MGVAKVVYDTSKYLNEYLDVTSSNTTWDCVHSYLHTDISSGHYLATYNTNEHTTRIIQNYQYECEYICAFALIRIKSFYVSTDQCRMIMMIPIGSQSVTTHLSALTQI